MTDKEIIKALECLEGEMIPCKDCSYVNYARFDCKRQAAKDTLDLINRQKAEIESNKAKIKISAECIARQDKEIERLNKQLEEFKFLESRVNSIKNTPKDTFSGALISIAEGVARYEAIKEFAERLKEYVESYDVTTGYRVTIVQAVEEETIDNLVKEMVGEG